MQIIHVLWASLVAFVWDEAANTVKVESLLAIGGTGILGAGALWGRRLWAWGKGLLPSRSPSSGWPMFDADAIRRSSRVLYIDDSAKSKLAHLDRLQSRWLSVEHWRAIDPTSISGLEERFDLLILDFDGVTDGLGASDGLQALEVIRQDNAWLPVVICSAFLNNIEGSRRERMDTLVQGVVSKIVPYHEFEPLLVDVVEQARTRERFVQLLEAVGVTGPEGVVAAVERRRTVPQLALRDGPNVPARRLKANRLVRIAQTILDGTRWPSASP